MAGQAEREANCAGRHLISPSPNHQFRKIADTYIKGGLPGMAAYVASGAATGIARLP